MFFRVKRAGSYQYLQIVHSTREGQKVRQQVFGTLGRLDEITSAVVGCFMALSNRLLLPNRPPILIASPFWPKG
jgi:hypothetical protein